MSKQKDLTEGAYLFQVFRNALILAGLYFFSVWSVVDVLDFAMIKPIIIFMFTYFLVELTKHYGIDRGKIPTKKGTLILN